MHRKSHYQGLMTAATAAAENTEDARRLQTLHDDSRNALELAPAEYSRYRCCSKYGSAYPYKFRRARVFVWGVIVPLFSILAVSSGFGYALAVFEAPHEIQSNNLLLAHYAQAFVLQSLFLNVTKQVPVLCMQLYLLKNQNQTNDLQSNLLQLLSDANLTEAGPIGSQVLHAMQIDGWLANSCAAYNAAQTNSNGFNTTSATTSTTIEIAPRELVPYSQNCTKRFSTHMEQLRGAMVTASQGFGESLTFHWNRCPQSPTNLTQDYMDTLPLILRNLNNDMPTLLPSAQAEGFKQTWLLEVSSLYDAYLLDYGANATGMDAVAAEWQAFNRSLFEASGDRSCKVNTVSSIWFWFTGTLSLFLFTSLLVCRIYLLLNACVFK
jgi:hypothetical protein